MYGLKQTPRAWYSHLDEFLLSLGFEKSLNEATLYVKKVDKDILIVSVYVDDLLITGNHEQLVDEFKLKMKNKFEMNELGLLSYFLGMEITQSNSGCFVCQRNFTMKLLNKFAMDNCKPVSTPMVVG